MRDVTLWSALLGVEKTVVEGVEFDEDEQLLVAHVRRRWRALDLGTVQVMVEADAPRVACRSHGPTVAMVPWARHGAGHAHVFDEQCEPPPTPIEHPRAS